MMEGRGGRAGLGLLSIAALGGRYLVQYWFRNPKTSSAQTADPK